MYQNDNKSQYDKKLKRIMMLDLNDIQDEPNYMNKLRMFNNSTDMSINTCPNSPNLKLVLTPLQSGLTKFGNNFQNQKQDSIVPTRNSLEMYQEQKLKLFQKRVIPLSNYTTIHGIETVTNRVRYDDNKLLREHFGANFKDQGQLNNFQQFKTRMPKFLPHQFQTRDNNQVGRCSLISILEINSDQFEKTLKICSRRLKAEKYQHLQKNLDETNWNRLFGKTEGMRQRENKINLKKIAQQNYIKSMREKSMKMNNGIQEESDFILHPQVDGINI